ncbi:MAG: hypothetical protein U9R39_07000 [Campylobacterota bacterium]|nr:hypothetical protein [Campylobacterota bacterium]
MSLFGSIGKAFSPTKIKKRTFDPEKMSVEDISIPVCLRNLDIDTAKNMINEEFGTFRSLGYKDKPLEQIKMKEYHSYQIGIILRCLQEDVVFFYPKIEEVLPSMVAHITKKQLHMKVFDIVYRYDNLVAKDALGQELIVDMQWTPLDMAYLLYYLCLEDRVIPKK